MFFFVALASLFDSDWKHCEEGLEPAVPFVGSLTGRGNALRGVGSRLKIVFI
jgi:hypothetical protein